MLHGVTVGGWWRGAQAQLDQARDSAPREAREMLERLLGLDNNEIIEQDRRVLTADKLEMLGTALARRLTGEPLAYVLGGAWFYGRWWPVAPGVLIPRPDSEVLVEAALACLPVGGLVVDVCCGSGVLGGTLALQRHDIRVVLSDIDGALVLAAGATLGKFGLGERVSVLSGDLLAAVDVETYGPADLVVCNPPYVSDAEWATLEPEVRDWEPKLALVGATENPDGLRLYRDLVPQAYRQLTPDGWLMMEIGWQQGVAVRDLLPETQWQTVRIIKDLAGRDRVVAAQRRG